MNSSTRVYFLSLTLLLACIPGCSLATQAWQRYQVDEGEYLESRLPTEPVTYVYSSLGILLGIIRNGGDFSDETLVKIKNTLKSHDFQNQNNGNLAQVAKSINDFILDQGYSLHNLISHHTKYTLLIFVENVENKPGCEFLSSMERSYENAIREAVGKKDTGASEYAVVVLSTGSSTIKVSCSQ